MQLTNHKIDGKTTAIAQTQPDLFGLEHFDMQPVESVERGTKDTGDSQSHEDFHQGNAARLTKEPSPAWE